MLEFKSKKAKAFCDAQRDQRTERLVRRHSQSGVGAESTLIRKEARKSVQTSVESSEGQRLPPPPASNPATNKVELANNELEAAAQQVALYR